MKKTVTALLTLSIMLSMTACSNRGTDMNESNITSSGAVDTQEPKNGENETGGDLASLAEKLSGQMAGGDFSETCSLFTDAVAAQLDEKALKDAWEKTVAGIGAYIGYHSTEATAKGGSTIVKSILEYEKSGLTVLFTFNEYGKIDGLWLNYCTIPAAAESTASYTEIPVEIGEYGLDGLLTLPSGAEKPPVIIMLQGSGQHDYDETIGAAQNKPFRDIARGLAERGIATLRYNKRYYQYPEKASADITIEDEATEDAAAAIAFAKGRDEVDGDKIIILGHSLGGMLAPRIAAENADVKGIISLAGSPRNLADIILDQNTDALNASSISKDEKEKKLEQVRAETERIKSLTEQNVGESKAIFGISAVYWLSLNKSVGADFVGSLNLPMLFLQGGSDFQVKPETDFKAWQDILSGKKRCSFKLYDGLNHLFMKTNGKTDITEYDPAGSVDEAVLDDIAGWINEAFK